MSIDINFKDIVSKMAEFEVLVAKAHVLFEQQTGIKVDKMTDFLMKFICLEDMQNRDVTMTILANTLMTNENTIRSKLKTLIENDLVEICKCGCDGRTRKIKPTKLLHRLLVIDATSKLKTMESLSSLFKEAFGSTLKSLYKEHKVEPYKAFTDGAAHKEYNSQYLDAKNRYKNTLNNLA